MEDVRIRDISQEERAGVWHGVISEIAGMPDSRIWSLKNTLISIKKPMLSIFAIIAVLVLGVSGTVAASDGARPGDLLFGVDRAVEDIRINFAGGDKKDDLRIAFAEERVLELKNIIDKEESEDNDDDQSVRVAGGIETATAFLELVSAQIASSTDKDKMARIEAIIAELNAELGGLSEDIKIDLRENNQLRVRFENGDSDEDGDGDDDSRVEIKTDDGKLKIEIKDGELRIKSNLFDNGDDDDSSTDGQNGLEAEADVFTDGTVIKVEINDNKTVFTTTSNTREAVIEDILAKFPSLSRAQVEAVLSFEIENRAQRADDSNSTSSIDDNDDDDDNSGSDDDDDDDDSDDDNGGSGNGGSGSDD